MKKFLVFLVSIVVVVCFGLTTYYFMRNDEVITINTKELYCNAGDIVSLDALDIQVKKPHRKTSFNYNAGSEEVKNAVSYNEETGCYEIATTAGGEVELVISTTNKKYSEFKVKLHIGNGSVENPYYVFNQVDLNKIGTVYRLDSSYSLMNNIALTSDFKPIGYSEVSGAYVGFSGNFYGNGYTISGLNLNSNEYDNAGLFYSINAGATVKELTINNATINGAYTNAGILAGFIAGNVEKIAVVNSTITNAKSNSFVGALAGVYNGTSLKVAYADNVAINFTGNVVEGVEGEEPTTEALTSVTAGGFVGKLNETTAIATYANDVTINLNNTTGVVGGYAGEFVINTNAGSIQQSYANTNCAYSDFAGFVGKVTKASGFNDEEANMLTYFIGNIAVVSGKTVIADSDLVKSYDTNLFKNQAYAGESAFNNPNASLFLIRGFASAGEVVEANEYVYYAVDANNKTLWDTTYVWETSTTRMPSLVMGSIEPNLVSGEYFRKDLTQVEVSEASKTFEELFAADTNELNIKLLEDVDLSTGWTPVNISNCTIDGNGVTIKVNLNNVKDNQAGLFAKIDNCTIKNLNIVVTGVNANATYVGALAGSITSSASTMSTIENVTISFEDSFGAVTITSFGGVAGQIEKTTITNCSVTGLNVNKNANIERIGAIVGVIMSGTVENSTANAILYGTTYVGGVASSNSGTISNVNAQVKIANKEYNNTYLCLLGGVASYNDGTIVNTSVDVEIKVEANVLEVYAGGVAAMNTGYVESTTITGSGIAVANIGGVIYVGGVAGSNGGTIKSTYNKTTSIGGYHVGKNIKAAGIVAVNSGTIYKVLSTSNVYGNYAAGVVVEMKTSGSIDQVVIGNYDASARTLSANTIVGDKYVAGVAVDFRAGIISNVQASSVVEGKASETRTSLVVLVFPRGAVLTNATINSTVAGYGKFYRESWVDFSTDSKNTEFDVSISRDGLSITTCFNILTSSAYCGEITSVVINANYANGKDVQTSMATVANVVLVPAGNDYNGTNFVKVVSNFADYNEFVGPFTFNCAYNSLWKYYDTASKTLTFNIGSIWENNNGISLMFLANVK